MESSKADDDETVELVDLLSSSMLFSIESSDDQPSLTLAVVVGIVSACMLSFDLSGNRDFVCAGGF